MASSTSDNGRTTRLDDILSAIQEQRGDVNTNLIYKAYVYSAKVHQGQLRQSGEPYLTHPLAVAHVLAELGMDLPTIAAGLLHDTVEDTWATLADVENNFGAEVSQLVAGVTKLSQFVIQSKRKRQVESFRNMFFASMDDPRVMVIKLADRLHNMRTLGVMRPEKQERIANETLNIFAPIGRRLGMQGLSAELEDISFRILQPERYDQLLAIRTEMLAERETDRESTINLLSEALANNEIACTVSGRIKTIYSIHVKLEAEKLKIEELWDLVAFRVVVDTDLDCYRALGVIHALWLPVEERFKDYIAKPKSNGYQSLHTTVQGSHGSLVEIQMRTAVMHRVAEEGIAAHYAYKEDSPENPESATFLRLMRHVLDATEGQEKHDAFFKEVKEKLTEGHIIVYTPKGDAIELPEGATVLDFAFRIHTDMGLHCAGAVVNGRWVPTRQPLVTGDVITIQTHTATTATREWLQNVVTHSAKSKIRAHLREIEEEEAIRQGQDMLLRMIRNTSNRSSKLDESELRTLAKSLGVSSVERLYASLGSGRIAPAIAKEKLGVLLGESRTRWSDVPASLIRALRRESEDKADILVGSEGGTLFRLARCCKPIEGDNIVGFVTRGRGVTVHRDTCDIVSDADASRLLTAVWRSEPSDSRPKHSVRIRVTMHDEPGVLASVSQAIAKSGANITESRVRASEDGGIGIFTLLVRNRAQLDRVRASITKNKSVEKVERIG